MQLFEQHRRDVFEHREAGRQIAERGNRAPARQQGQHIAGDPALLSVDRPWQGDAYAGAAQPVAGDERLELCGEILGREGRPGVKPQPVLAAGLQQRGAADICSQLGTGHGAMPFVVG